MTHRVDAPGRMVKQEHADEPAPQESQRRACPCHRDESTDDCRNQKSKPNPDWEEIIDAHDGRIRQQVWNISIVAITGTAEEPPDMGVCESDDPTDNSRLATCVRRVRIVLLIRVVMMLAVRRDPPDKRSLSSHAAEDHEENPNRLWRRKRLVREHTVISNRDPQTSRNVKNDHHDEIE